MTTPRSHCAAVVLSQRFVYLLPGANPGAVRGNSLLIDYLDTGANSEFTSLNAGAPIASKIWESLEVKDSAFVRAQPVCGWSLQNEHKLILFGGQSVSGFILSDLKSGQVTVKPLRGNFKEKPVFCNGSDTVVKMLNSKLYAMDASSNQLHIFDANLSQWTTNSLTYFKVPL